MSDMQTLLGLLMISWIFSADRISHVHIHDNMGKKDEHLPLGKGTIDWKLVMEKLSDYKGIFVTEMSSVEEGIQSLEFLRKL